MSNNEKPDEGVINDHYDPAVNDEEPDKRAVRYQKHLVAWSKLLDGLQRVICLGLAAWHYICTGDTWGSLIIIAAGFIDARTAKAIIMKFLNLKK